MNFSNHAINRLPERSFVGHLPTAVKTFKDYKMNTRLSAFAKILTIVGIVSPVIVYFQSREGHLVGHLKHTRHFYSCLRQVVMVLGVLSGVGIPLVAIMWGCAHLANQMLIDQFLSVNEFQGRPNIEVPGHAWRNLFFLENDVRANQAMQERFVKKPLTVKPEKTGQLGAFLHRSPSFLQSMDERGVLAFMSTIRGSSKVSKGSSSAEAQGSSLYVDSQGTLYFIGKKGFCDGPIEKDAVQFLKTVQELGVDVQFDVRQGVVDSENGSFSVVALSPERHVAVLPQVAGQGKLRAEKNKKKLLDVFCRSADNGKIPYSEFFSVGKDGSVQYTPLVTPAHLSYLWIYNAFIRMTLYVDTVEEYEKLLHNYQVRGGREPTISVLLSKKFFDLVSAITPLSPLKEIEHLLSLAVSTQEVNQVHEKWLNWLLKNSMDDKAKEAMEKKIEQTKDALALRPRFFSGESTLDQNESPETEELPTEALQNSIHDETSEKNAGSLKEKAEAKKEAVGANALEKSQGAGNQKEETKVKKEAVAANALEKPQGAGNQKEETKAQKESVGANALEKSQGAGNQKEEIKIKKEAVAANALEKSQTAEKLEEDSEEEEFFDAVEELEQEENPAAHVENAKLARPDEKSTQAPQDIAEDPKKEGG